MKKITIFLASSVLEFRAERKELGDFIRSLNNIYIEKGIYYEFIVSNAVDKKRKQEQYNKIIEQCDYFYILIGSTIGRYTMEEFKIALRNFKLHGYPKIYTYFINSEKISIAGEAIVSDFKKELEQNIGHYYNVYKNIDSIKLNLLVELLRDSFVYNVEQDKSELKSGDILFKNNLYGITDKHKKIMNDELSFIEEKAIQELEKENVKGALDILRGSKRKIKLGTSLNQLKMKKRIFHNIYRKNIY